MEFKEIDIAFETYTVEDLNEGMTVYADIGEYVTDIRTATVEDVHEDERTVSLSLGPARMDNPYVVPISQIHEIQNN